MSSVTPDFSRIPWRKLHCDAPDLLRADWLALSWQARGLYGLLLTKSDRQGGIALGRIGLPGCAAILGAPAAELLPVLAELIASGFAEDDRASHMLRLPYFAASQDAISPEGEKKRKQRSKPGHEGDSPGTVPGQDGTTSGQVVDSPGTTGDIPDRIENRELRSEKRDLRKENPPKSPSKGDIPVTGLNPISTWIAIEEAAGGPKVLGLARNYGTIQPLWLDDNRAGFWAQNLHTICQAKPAPTLDDWRKLGRWLGSGGAEPIKAPWQLLSKAGAAPNISAWLDAAAAWDEKAVPGKTDQPGPPPPAGYQSPVSDAERFRSEAIRRQALGLPPQDFGDKPDLEAIKARQANK